MLGTVGFKGAVDYTVVNGKIVVRNGKLTGIDEEKAVYEGKRAVNEISEQIKSPPGFPDRSRTFYLSS